VPSFWANVNNVVRGLDEVEVVLDNDDCITLFNKVLKNFDEFANIFVMETNGRFIEKINSFFL
jgi:hypothetical protein